MCTLNNLKLKNQTLTLSQNNKNKITFSFFVQSPTFYWEFLTHKSVKDHFFKLSFIPALNFFWGKEKQLLSVPQGTTTNVRNWLNTN